MEERHGTTDEGSLGRIYLLQGSSSGHNGRDFDFDIQFLDYQRAGRSDVFINEQFSDLRTTANAGHCGTWSSG